VQSSSRIITTNKPTPNFLQAGCPSCRSTNSVKALKGNITPYGLAYPKLTWGLPTLSLTTNSSWLPWGMVAMPLISPLMPVPQGSVCISFSIVYFHCLVVYYVSLVCVCLCSAFWLFWLYLSSDWLERLL